VGIIKRILTGMIYKKNKLTEIYCINGDKITEKSGLTYSILKIIWFVSVSCFLLLGTLPYYEEHIKGEQILSDYIDSSENVNADVTLTENKVVTFFFEPIGSHSYPELLKIIVIDPQNRKYSFDKKLYPTIRVGILPNDYFSFTPKVSGIHHIEIGNATSFTDIELFSGMINPYQQPSFMMTFFISFVIMLTGLLSLRKKAVMELVYSGKIVNEILYFCLAIPISWIILNNLIKW
jgi:hypothetical protein